MVDKCRQEDSCNASCKEEVISGLMAILAAEEERAERAKKHEVDEIKPQGSANKEKSDSR